MRYTLIDNVQQGEKLGKHIYASDGRVLLHEGVQLTIAILSRLRRMGVQAIYIKDERTADIKIEEVVSEKVKRETIVSVKDAFQFIQSGKNLDVRNVQNTTKSVIDELIENQKILLSLTDIRTEDNELYVHSVNVCLLSSLIGLKMGLDRKKLHDLALGALLHDIGKVKTKDIQVESNDQNNHMWRGFNELRKNKEISLLSAHIALSHHEYLDGSGTPRKLVDEQIPLLSKIVTVANYYDNLLSPAPGKIGLFPYEACEHILGLTNVYFSHEVVWQFLRAVAFYPTGSQVKLSTGETGVIVGQNDGLPQRPIVRIFKVIDRTTDEFEVEQVDLAKETTIFIKEMLG